MTIKKDENEKSVPCGTNGIDDKCIKNLEWKIWREDLNTGEKIILKWI
jgi:hypothetical protein